MVGKLTTVLKVLRLLGPGFLLFRLGYALKLKLGYFKWRLPARPWDAFSLPSIASSRIVPLFDPTAMRDAYRSAFSESFPTVIERADRVLDGELQYFFHDWQRVGFPPPWHKNPYTGQSAPADRHWSDLDDFGFGDIKVLWEPSRFAFAYDLTRAFLATGDEGYAEGFWRALEDWRAANPPQLGVNWKCGQEVSIRLMAWIFALNGLAYAAASTHQRKQLLLELISVSARRVEVNLAYALSQKSNHGHSEAVALFTAGALLPDLPGASRWKDLGARLIIELTRELIYEDGFCCMYSMNYLRCMLDVLLWASWVARACGDRSDTVVQDRMEAAMRFLHACMDATGRVPNYGSNDGALNLPISTCDYRDFRPTVQAVAALLGQRMFPAGPWDEMAFWVTGGHLPETTLEITAHQDFLAPCTGVGILRSGETYAMMRAGRTPHRATHSDMLACHLTWRGHPLVIDAGTYSYNASAPFNKGLAGSAFHNALIVDNVDQMESITRFIKYPRVNGLTRGAVRSDKGLLAAMEGSHGAYERLPAPVRCSRVVLQAYADYWIVIDIARSLGVHDYSVNWLLGSPPVDPRADHLILEAGVGQCHVAIGCDAPVLQHSLVRADKQSGIGHSSEYYNSLEARWCLLAVARAANVVFHCCFSPEPVDVSASSGSFLWGFSGFRIEAKLDLPKCIGFRLVDRQSGQEIDALKVLMDGFE